MSSEIFPKRLHLALDSLNGVVCVTDDIIVFGSGDKLDQASADHDLNLKLLLQRCRERKIKPNKEKVQLKELAISFMGHLVTRDGLLLDSAKIDAITKLQPPTSVERGTATLWNRELPGKVSATTILCHVADPTTDA